MSDVVIRVDELGKRYQINGKQQAYRTFREAIIRTVRTPLDRLAARRDQENNTFWSLKDVTFEVKRGEVLGIIGRNGAGKSTLLKILSRITEPTTGAVYLKGRVGALLEVGTGFHHELTGRENIYLSGTILGMTRAEIDRKFDEIVDFAGVEQFIDTPVKRYSSGMGLRLGFAVAAHLEPEILVVDEVLAVGDAEFQKKCLGKMSDVAREGRTIIFVSHNMGAVRQLCSRGIWLDRGVVARDDKVINVIHEYLQQAESGSVLQNNDISVKLAVLDSSGNLVRTWGSQETIHFRVEVFCNKPLPKPTIDLSIYSMNGAKLFAFQSDHLASNHNNAISLASEYFSAVFEITNLSIAVSEVYVDLGIRSQHETKYLGLFEQVVVIQVVPPNPVYSRYEYLLHCPATFEVIGWR